MIMNNDNIVLRLSGVTYSYAGTKKRVLKDINLEIKQGEFVGIIGANGAGKSTLCYCFNGLIPLAHGGNLRGEVIVRGVNTRDSSVPAIAQWVGLVFSNPEAQLTQLSVADEIAFGPANLGVPLQEINTITMEILEMVQLQGLESRNTRELSGGQQQRLAIASVLAMRPEILVLDEPTSNLDPRGVVEVYSAVEKLNREKNTTVIMVDHAVDQLSEFATRVIALHNGEIIADGPPEEVFGNVELLSSANIQIPEIPELFDELQKAEVLKPCLASTPVTVEQGFNQLKKYF